MNNLLIKFLDTENIDKSMFTSYEKYKNSDFLEKLESKFENFKISVSFLSYVNKVINYTALEYCNKQNKLADREQLTLNICDDDYKDEKINLIKDVKQTEFDEEVLLSSQSNVDFKDIISDRSLLSAIESLTKKQKEVLYKNIVLELTEKQLSKEYQTSQQAINKIKHAAISNIRHKLEV